MILYHYCSNLAFHSIMMQKCIRLSLLSLSNDSKEGQHFLDVAHRLLPDDKPFKSEVLKQLQSINAIISAIGFCLSADGDVLSQWRGYADNAQGVAIGFDSEALKLSAQQESGEPLVIRLAPVAYKDDFLVKHMMPVLQPIFELYESGKLAPPRTGTLLTPITEEESEKETERYKKANGELFLMLMKMANFAYAVKSPFFSEEKEWRILSFIVRSDEVLVLPDAQFQPTSDKIKPFRNFPLKGFTPAIVKELILGPRNETPDEVMRLFLNSQGFEHVNIRRSNGSYR